MDTSGSWRGEAAPTGEGSVQHPAPMAFQRGLLYKQFEEALRGQILKGELAPGTRLPSDMQYCREYGISRVTVRKALDRLVADGLVRRDVGRGTFVDDPRLRPRSNNLALFGFVSIGDVTSFALEILRGVEDAARREGYHVLFTCSNYDPVQEGDHIRSLISRGVDGLIILPTFQPSSVLSELAASDFACVLVDRHFDDVPLDCVCSDNELGGYQAARHLLELGHRRIGFVGRVPLSSSVDRWRGYLRALDEWQVASDEALVVSSDVPPRYEPDVLTFGQPKDTASFAAVQDLLERERPSALICFSEYYSIIAAAAIRDLGLTVGHDVSMVGFDRNAHHFIPDSLLTIVTQAPFMMGATAVQLLMERLRDGRRTPRLLRLPTQLVGGRSTRRHRARRSE